MSKYLLLFAIIMAAVVMFVFSEPHPATTVNATADTGDNDVIASDFGGPPDQEVAFDGYTLLTAYARDYPQLRPMIRAALADNKVTWAEYDRIDKAERPLALKAGEVKAHDESAPYRKKLAAALAS